jgi:tRNA nucleotidyltransferase (CCA-adding enzyme)
LKNVRLQVNGQDLLELGYRPGPRFKEIFDLLLERKMAGDLRNKKEEIAFLLSSFPPSPDHLQNRDRPQNRDVPENSR